MKGLQNTIVVVVIVILSAQLAHFTYMKFLYPTTSVLDDEVDAEIQLATSLEDLVGRFEKSRAEVEEYEEELPAEARGEWHRRDIEPYATNEKLRAAILDWERKDEESTRLLFQWTVGLLVAAVGVGAYARGSRWIGIALTLAGLIEMVWWSSPSISLEGAVGEFEKILNLKLVLSVLTAVGLGGAWIVWQRDR